MPNFWVYIIHCANNGYYTGYAKHLIQRYQAHVKGVAAKYTRSFPPTQLAQAWPIYGDKQQAMKIENFIKSLNKREKSLIIKDPELLYKKIFTEI